MACKGSAIKVCKYVSNTHAYTQTRRTYQVAPRKQTDFNDPTHPHVTYNRELQEFPQTEHKELLESEIKARKYASMNFMFRLCQIQTFTPSSLRDLLVPFR